MSDSNKSGDNRADANVAGHLTTALTCAVVPILSHLLTLVFGENDLWASERLFVLYFAFLSGWIIRGSLQSWVARAGLKSRGYTFMDSDAAGSAVMTFPVLVALTCWNFAVGVVVLLALYLSAAYLLWTNRNRLHINVGHMCLAAVCVVLTIALAETFLFGAFATMQSEALSLIVYIVLLLILITLNIFADQIRIWRGNRK